MNIQSERLDNHTARFTVEVEPKQWEQAKKDAAREISKQIRVKGFRKGKAPYKMIVRHVGEKVITEEAVETLGNEVYREVIQTTDYKPYAAGSLEAFQLDPQPTYTFTVPLVPEIDLGDYRDVREDYEAPEVSDEEVDVAMRQLQQQQAVVEESANPVQSGDRVNIDIHSEFADGEEAPEAIDDEEEPDGEEASDEVDDAEPVPYKGDSFIHQHDATVNLDPENEPALPGFIEALVGANVEETVEFELTIPEDDEDYSETVHGRKVHFEVTVNKIENVTLPELNDELAARITEKEDEPLTLLELRLRTREQLQEQAERQALNQYFDKVVDKIAEGTTLSYPEIMVDERVHDMIHEFEQKLKEQGIDLETYQRVMRVTHEDLHEQYEGDAVKSLERTLILGEILAQEKIQVTAVDVATEIDKTLSQFGDQADVFRQFFDTEQQRSMIANNILYERLMERLAKIGKGESLDEPEEDESGEEPEATTQADEPEATVQEAVEETTAEETVATEEEAESDDSDNTEQDDADEAVADDTETDE